MLFLYNLELRILILNPTLKKKLGEFTRCERIWAENLKELRELGSERKVRLEDRNEDENIVLGDSSSVGLHLSQ